jgi:hypothetical protein
LWWSSSTSGEHLLAFDSSPSFITSANEVPVLLGLHLRLPHQEIRESRALALQLFVMEHRVVDLLRTHAEEMMAELIEVDGSLVQVVLGIAPGRRWAKIRPQFVRLVARWIVGIGESECGEWLDPLLNDQTGPKSFPRSLLRERDVVLLTLLSDPEAAARA